MLPENFESYSLQELYELCSNLYKENKEDEAKKVFEEILKREKPPQPAQSNFAYYNEVTNDLASRGERFAAAVIDSVIMFVPIFILILIMFIVPGESYKNTSGIDKLLWMIGYQVMFLIINGWILYKHGQTIGKKILNIKIVDLNDNLPEMFASYGLRYFIPALFQLIPFIGWIIPFIDVLFIFGKNRRCIHDYLAGTKVISAV